jgi:hypothetical protein
VKIIYKNGKKAELKGKKLKEILYSLSIEK